MRDFGKALEGLEIDFSLSSDGLSHRAKNFLQNRLESIAYMEMLESPLYDTSDYTKQQRNIEAVLIFFWPNVAKTSEIAAEPSLGDKLSIWSNKYARDKGRVARSEVKIGRAIRKMFPVLTEVEIDRLVDDVKQHLFPKSWTVKEGSDKASFNRAYSFEQSEAENLDTTDNKKHMVNSCMRYDFSHLCCHPAEAYASGDFKVYWLEDAKGNIGGRVVVYHKDDKSYPAPIYAVSETSYNVLREKLDELGAEPIEDGTWTGARLLAIKDNGAYVGPYLDLRPRTLEVSHCENYLIITRDGNLDGSNYSGVYGDEDIVHCSDCSCRMDLEDAYTFQDAYYCSSCYYDHAFTCENCYDDQSVDDQCYVMVRTSYGHNHEQSWCEHCRDNHAVETENGQLWSDDDVIHTADCLVIDPDTAAQDYFRCHLDGEYYHNDEMQFLAGGGVCSTQSIRDYNDLAPSSESIYVYDATNEVWELEERKDKDVA